ncbi:hypothetical protein McpSp1_14060 [Methanocorpusculaceae archaeon Sp1]|nr:hypothetical protein [Methanocorpusculaceae archaeon Sp1]
MNYYDLTKYFVGFVPEIFLEKLSKKYFHGMPTEKIIFQFRVVHFCSVMFFRETPCVPFFRGRSSEYAFIMRIVDGATKQNHTPPAHSFYISSPNIYGIWSKATHAACP